jgi:hypothetical protein
MAFTANEIANIANSALDFYFNKGGMFEQSLQDRPLLKLMEDRKKPFPGGKGNISLAVRGTYGDGTAASTVQGYNTNDQVSFYTPATNLRVNFPWREHHIGLTLTHTELKVDGISVVDTNGERTTEHSKREMTVLVNLLESKLFDLGEQYARGMNGLLWGDGTADPKALAGMQSIIVATPGAGTCGGLSRATNAWWNNRAITATYGGGPIVGDVTDGGSVLSALQKEYLQLIRFGGKPTVALAGSDFIDEVTKERRANGFYSMTGFSGTQDMSVGDMTLPGGAKLQYDPTLDDLGYAKRLYWFDPKVIILMAMEDEWRKDHTPARPANQFVMYRSITSTGQMIATQLNSSGVYDIA